MLQRHLQVISIFTKLLRQIQCLADEWWVMIHAMGWGTYLLSRINCGMLWTGRKNSKLYFMMKNTTKNQVYMFFFNFNT